MATAEDPPLATPERAFGQKENDDVHDIFLSHSSADHGLVAQVRADLTALGYDVFVDYEALPSIRPDEVTEATAQALREAMQRCTSLLYLISAKARRSRWMPWELGYFDGFRGRVFVYPVDKATEKYARGREYLRLYPIVPLEDREGFLARHVPRHSSSLQQVGSATGGEGTAAGRQPAVRVPLFDYGAQEATAVYGRNLEREAVAAVMDPMRWNQIAMEISTAWLRLWGLLRRRSDRARPRAAGAVRAMEMPETKALSPVDGHAT